MILMDTGETQRSKKRKIDDTSYDIFETYTEVTIYTTHIYIVICIVIY